MEAIRQLKLSHELEQYFDLVILELCSVLIIVLSPELYLTQVEHHQSESTQSHVLTNVIIIYIWLVLILFINCEDQVDRSESEAFVDVEASEKVFDT